MERLQGEQVTLDEQTIYFMDLRTELMHMSGVGIHNNSLNELECQYYHTTEFYITITNSQKILSKLTKSSDNDMIKE